MKQKKEKKQMEFSRSDPKAAKRRKSKLRKQVGKRMTGRGGGFR